MNTIYVYAGENRPKLQLTKIKDGLNIDEIVKYLHRIQDIFQLQLNAVETITGNLKIRSSLHGDDTDEYDKPFYILEYCFTENAYSLWKSRTEWKLSLAVANLYNSGSTMVDLSDEVVSYFKDLPHSTEILKLLAGFHIKDASAIGWASVAADIAQFLETFGKDSSVDLNQLKTTLALSLLKSMIQLNKKALQSTLLSYNTKVQKEDESPIPSPPASTAKPTRATSVESEYTLLPSTQLQSNFNTFFQSMAENFETYDTERPATKKNSSLPSLLKGKTTIRRKPAGQVHKTNKKRSLLSTK